MRNSKRISKTWRERNRKPLHGSNLSNRYVHTISPVHREITLANRKGKFDIAGGKHPTEQQNQGRAEGSRKRPRLKS